MKGLPGASTEGGGNPEILGVTVDSRRVAPGMVFAALEGEITDGLLYAAEAAERGAAAILSDRPRPEGRAPETTWITVEQPRRAVAWLARELAGRPDEELAVVAVTGSNGKTTCAHLTAAALEAGGLSTGILGTVGYRLPGESLPAERTTPEASELFPLLRRMVEAGCEACAAEVSSHALDRERVHGLSVRAAVFTNLSPEHLDYHGDMESYFRAKARLFESLPPEATAVLNADDPRSADLAGLTRARVLSYGTSPWADWRVEELRPRATGNSFRLRGPGGLSLELDSSMPGGINATNLAAAVAAAATLGVPARAAAAGAAGLSHVPGRFERVDRGQPFTVWVDYAHTEDALSRVLAAARAVAAGRVLLVFGCGGDRDRSKRPRMGEAAARGADLVVATSDNPRSEDPAAILEEVLPALRGVEHHVEPDRRRAIRQAVDAALPGDLVVVAGKGHETGQAAGGRVEPFDDRREAAAALEARREREGGSWS
jgi:UDP-N-acetylmuramoyl-L-alanyl-D-glutamate--2,6-diaminopimelate ligase